MTQDYFLIIVRSSGFVKFFGGLKGILRILFSSSYIDTIPSQPLIKITGATAPVLFLFRCIQHVFNENAISFGRIIYQNIRYRTYQFPILDDWTAAHE